MANIGPMSSSGLLADNDDEHKQSSLQRGSSGGAKSSPPTDLTYFLAFPTTNNWTYNVSCIDKASGNESSKDLFQQRDSRGFASLKYYCVRNWIFDRGAGRIITS